MAWYPSNIDGGIEITHIFSTNAGSPGTVGRITLSQSIENFDLLYVTTGINTSDSSIASVSTDVFLVDDIKDNYEKNYYMGRSGNNDTSSRIIFINATTISITKTVDVTADATIRNIYGIKFKNRK